MCLKAVKLVKVAQTDQINPFIGKYYDFEFLTNF